nr:ABC transporter ATP-binding protein [Dactylosporangium thailandense]
MTQALLSIRDLTVGIRDTTPVRGVDLDIAPGEIVGIVGETGSGKSLSALSVLRLLNHPVRITGGQVLFDGTDLTGLPERRLRAVRGGRIGMIFQDPMTALNPYHRVGDQIVEAIREHRPVGRAEAHAEAVRLLGEVGIVDPAGRARQFPHELSGGMRQRAMIAMALANRPALLIADEPTTGLDVTIEAQILALVKDLNRRHGMAVMMITHNLGVVAGLCERTVVMYGGRIVESGPTAELFADPRHPYTRALLGAVPRRGHGSRPLTSIPGLPPDLRAMPAGCAFHPRCPVAVARCHEEDPPLSSAGERSWRCLRAEEAS